MNEIETMVYLQTKLRNLKRKQAKLSQHAELTPEYYETQKQIHEIEAQITTLQ